MAARFLHTPDGAALAVFVLIAAAVTGPALLGRAALVPEAILDSDPLYRTEAPASKPTLGDYTGIVIDYPRDLAFAGALQAGRLDRWNPLVGCGAPLWADQGGPFFPLKLVFYLFPSGLAFDAFIALRLVLAAYGAFLLARAHGLSVVGAIAAGATFELSGALAAQLAFGSSSATYLLPWVVLGADWVARPQTVRGRTWRHVAGAAIALGIAGHGGHPTLVMLQFGAFGAAVLGHFVARLRDPLAALALAGRAAVALLLGLAIAAPALVPLAELTSVGTSYKFHSKGDYVRLTHLSRSRQGLPIALFAPALVETFFARANTLHPFGASIGLLGAVAAFAGFLHRSLTAATAMVLALGIVLAMQPPPFDFIEHLPGISLLLPAYAWPLVVLVLALAAGRGVQAFENPAERHGFLLALLALPVATLTLLLIRDDQDLTSFATLLRETASSSNGMLRLLLPQGAALAAIAICLAFERTRVAAPLLVALLVVERVATVLPLAHNPPGKVLAAPPSPAVAFLRERLAPGDFRMIGLPAQIGYPSSPMLYGLPDLRQVSALPVRRFHDYLEAIFPEKTWTVMTAGVAASPLLDLAAVRYLVLPRIDVPDVLAEVPIGFAEIPQPTDSHVRSVHRDAYVEIYENRAALARWRIVHKSVAVSDAATSLAWVRAAAAASQHADGGVLADTVVLEPDEQGRSAPALSFSAAAGESVRAVEQSDPERLVLEAELVEPGLLVIADTYYPGWKAWVDGEPAPIHPADHLFRAVALSPGRHRIEMRYEPRSFRLGAGLFGAAALACAAAFLLGRRPAA